MHLLASAPLALQLSLVNEIFSEMVSDQMIEASLSLSLFTQPVVMLIFRYYGGKLKKQTNLRSVSNIRTYGIKNSKRICIYLINATAADSH